MKRTKEESIELCFAALASAASTGARCPENGTCNVVSAYVVELARAGRIRIEISGHNYRTVYILTGDQKGKSTAPDPARRKPWKIIDKNGTRKNGKHMTFGADRSQPSAPRLLTSAEIYGAGK